MSSLLTCRIQIGQEDLLAATISEPHVDHTEEMIPFGIVLARKQSAMEAELAAWIARHPDADPNDAEIQEGGVPLDTVLHPNVGLTLEVFNPTDAPVQLRLCVDGTTF